MSDTRKVGRVTIPTDLDVVPQTLEILKRWGADAIRDCDGTDFPAELQSQNAKIYSTYYTTRKDNVWAKANPDEVQQCYIMTGFHTAAEGALEIPLMKGISPELMEVNTRDDIKRWWEVVDRTAGAPICPDAWDYNADTGCVVIHHPEAFHEYTVAFLAYLIWDPVHMYNAVTNNWQNFEHQITFDVRQPKTHKFTMERLRKFIAEHPYVNVIRYTTFFHQFTLMFDELKRERFVDWYGYSASVSPYILEQFEKEVGYKFRPEYIVDQGYYNNQYRVPSKEFKDFQAFQRREVAALAKEMVDITHELGKEAMMFLGDHWIGTEPFMEEWKTIGVDAVVGSVGNGSTLRLISDIPGVKYTEGRFLPYFFPDTFHEGGDPVKEAKENWVTARRAILRKPIDRIGYGGYLKLALEFPEFIDYVESVCNEFRELYENIKGTTPYCVKTVAVLNSWGKMRAWGCHMVHHALYQKQNYSYAGIIEALSGAPFDVKFISFDDIRKDPSILDSIDVIINLKDIDVRRPENRFNEEVTLPNGRGKDVKIGVIADGELIVQAKDAGLDTVINKGDLEEFGKDRKSAKKMDNSVDFLVAQADMMPLVGRFLGPILGPRNKMPKPVPASARIEPLLERVQATIKVGVKQQPSIQILVGTQDMEDEKLAENIEAVLAVLDRNLEKGRNQIKSMYIKATMGSVVRVI